MLKRPILHNL